MTPIPLFILFVIIKLRNRQRAKADLQKENILEIGEKEVAEDVHVNGNYINGKY